MRSVSGHARAMKRWNVARAARWVAVVAFLFSPSIGEDERYSWHWPIAWLPWMLIALRNLCRNPSGGEPFGWVLLRGWQCLRICSKRLSQCIDLFAVRRVLGNKETEGS